MKLLLEIGTEELPAAFIPAAMADLGRHLRDGLQALRLEPAEPRVLATPRRLAAIVPELLPRQEERLVEVRGPSKAAGVDPGGKPTPAAIGFARGQGVDVDSLEVRNTPGGEYLFATRREAGAAAAEVLASFLPSLIQSFAFPKSMRWGDGELRFARPLRWILALLDDQVIPFTVGTVFSDRFTQGHRVLGPGRLPVVAALDYQDTLAQAGVIVDPAERRRLISIGAEQLAAEVGLRCSLDPALLDEVVQLVEYPTPFRGEFGRGYLELPDAILVTTMAKHQRYFPLLDPHGRLSHYFIGVRNGSDEHLEEVRRGNEKVLRARLADAEFFFGADLRQGLLHYAMQLQGITYQERLGSLAAKTGRLERLGVALGDLLGSTPSEQTELRVAASLAKADLASQVVREYPELQGIMGGEYARRAGESEAVATAIAEQYLPQGPESPVPESRCGRLLALSDKLDSLAGGFLVGLAPTGSQDPYGLRRAALGVIRILLTGLELDLEVSLAAALAGYSDFAPAVREQARAELLEFFRARLAALFGEEGFQPETVEAVLGAGFQWVGSLRSRLTALSAFQEEEGFTDFLTAYRRASRLAGSTAGEVRRELFQAPVEGELLAELRVAETELAERLAAADYLGYLRRGAALRGTLDRFLTDVLVMAPEEELRQNRLALLHRAVTLLGEVADFGGLSFRPGSEGVQAPGAK